MAIDFEALRKKLGQLSGTNSKRARFWRPEEGKEYNIRIIGFQDNDGNPFQERYFYYNIGNNPGLLAPYQFGKPDPIQELITKLRDEGSKESYELAKKLYPKMRCYAAVIVRGEESEGVRLWAFGKQVYQSLLNVMLDPDYGDITDPESGTDIVLNYDVPGTPGSFPKTTLKPRRRPSILCDDAVADCATLLESVPDFSTLFDEKTTQELETILSDYLAGSTSASDDDSAGVEKYNSGGDAVLEAMQRLQGK